MVRVLLLMLVAFSLLAVPAAAQDDRAYEAERFDVEIAVQEDGSLLISESVTFDFQGGPFTYVFRHLPTARTDGITVLEGTMDGLRMPGGIEPGELQVEGRDPIEVTWRFVPTRDTRATFGLTYLVEGVVQQTPSADVLTWQALPEEHEYPIAATTITVTYPSGVDLVAAPVVQGGSATIDTAPGQVRITANDLTADDFLVLTLPFTPGSIIQEPPRWQTQQQQVLNTVPEWLGLGALIFVAGLVLLLIWHTRAPGTAGGTRRNPSLVTAPPDELSPALAGALLHGGSGTWAHAMGTLFDLAQRGVLHVAELAEKKWYESRNFEVRLLEQPADLRPHERGLLDLLFTGKDGWQPAVRLSDLRSRLNKQWKHFAEPLDDELRLAGFLDPAGKQHKTRLSMVGAVLLIAGTIALLLMVVAALSGGMWPPIFVALALYALSVVAFIMAANTSLLSATGRGVQQVWQGFANHLRAIVKKRTETPPDVFEPFLPYAASFGLAESWVKFFQKQGLAEAPAWFQATAGSDGSEIAVFVALIAATNSAGDSSAAAGAAAGAAGGGASGAG